jgi:hypothetical protein
MWRERRERAEKLRAKELQTKKKFRVDFFSRINFAHSD